jgi:hypothetical protein
MATVEMICYICGSDEGTDRDPLIWDTREGERPFHRGCVTVKRMADHAEREQARETAYLQYRFGLNLETAKQYARECETYRRAGVLPADLRRKADRP